MTKQEKTASQPMLEERLSSGNIVLTAFVRRLGADLEVVITGGIATSPDRGAHVGCVCLGIPRPSLHGDGTRSATVSTLNVTGHKDDEIGALFAHRLAALTGGVCSVTCGVHVENASLDTIGAMIDLAREALSSLERRLYSPARESPERSGS